MDIASLYKLLSELKDIFRIGLLVLPVFQYHMYKNIGGILILPILVSLGFDIYSSYLIASGSWTIIIEFLYPVVGLLVGFAAFGQLIQNKVMFRVAYGITALTLLSCIFFVVFVHGIERTNLMRTTFVHGLAIPAALGVSIMFELDRIVSGETTASQHVRLLNRAWIFYFSASYAEWNLRYFKIRIEDKDFKALFDFGFDFFHFLGYVTLLVCYLYVINKNNLKLLWKIPQNS